MSQTDRERYVEAAHKAVHDRYGSWPCPARGRPCLGWRDREAVVEDNRIRRDDGTGYGDGVTDETVVEHRRQHLDEARDASEAVRRALAQVEFCDAVLALREQERAGGGS